MLLYLWEIASIVMASEVSILTPCLLGLSFSLQSFPGSVHNSTIAQRLTQVKTPSVTLTFSTSYDILSTVTFSPFCFLQSTWIHLVLSMFMTTTLVFDSIFYLDCSKSHRSPSNITFSKLFSIL
jgi:hypothetical protein